MPVPNPTDAPLVERLKAVQAWDIYRDSEDVKHFVADVFAALSTPVAPAQEEPTEL